MEAEDITEVAADDRPAGEMPAIKAIEHRAHPRFEVHEDASLLLVSHDSWHPCRVVDLSLEGCRLVTGDLFRAGTQKHVEVSFRINGIAFRLSGTTQWTDDQHLVGIRFSYPTPRRREELAEVLREVEAANAARAEREAQDELALRLAAVESPAVEEAVQAAELAPVQLPVARASITEPGNVARSDAAPGRGIASPVLNERERRAHVRHEVDSTAHIFLLHLGHGVVGRILNLSVGGCGIRTVEPFPLGIYTRVETEFHLRGMPFRLSGVIQFVYERNFVGIRFLDLSDRKLEQVNQLIAEMEKQYANREAEAWDD
ncbi:MAG: PilZ domain-containing protein [Terracidiphilus sp.]